MAIYTSSHTGQEIDSATTKALKISSNAARNGQALIWENDAYKPGDITLPSNVRASDITIDHSSSTNLNDGQPLSNLVNAVEDKVTRSRNGEDLNLTPTDTIRDPYIDAGTQISLSEFANKVCSQQINNGYKLVRDSITSITSRNTAVGLTNSCNKILIFFKNLTGSSTDINTPTQLLLGTTSNKLIPVLSSISTNSYSGYIELEHIGYTWKFTVIAYDGIYSSGSNISYIRTSPITYVSMDELSTTNSIYMMTQNGNISCSMQVYKYIR